MIQVRIPSFESQVPLLAGIEYGSGWLRTGGLLPHLIPHDIYPARYIVGLVFTDQIGTILVEQSNNAADVHFREALLVGPGIVGAVAYNRRIYATFVRVRYVNGATDQGVFSIIGYMEEES